MSTPAERRARAQAAALERWARTEIRAAATEAARDGLLAKFEREVDPEGKLSSAERMKGAEKARKAHYARMRMIRAKNAAARRRRG